MNWRDRLAAALYLYPDNFGEIKQFVLMILGLNKHAVPISKIIWAVENEFDIDKETARRTTLDALDELRTSGAVIEHFPKSSLDRTAQGLMNEEVEQFILTTIDQGITDLQMLVRAVHAEFGLNRAGAFLAVQNAIHNLEERGEITVTGNKKKTLFKRKRDTGRDYYSDDVSHHTSDKLKKKTLIKKRTEQKSPYLPYQHYPIYDVSLAKDEHAYVTGSWRDRFLAQEKSRGY